MPAPQLTPLVPVPERGRIFEHRTIAGLADCGPDGLAQVDAIARWLQDAAFADVVDVGLDGLGIWVVRRCRIRVERFPAFREPLTARTFCSGVGALWAERRTVIEGELGGRVEAVALWVHVDPATERPKRPGEPFLAVYGESAGGRQVKARLRHPVPPSEARARSWTFRAADLDVAGHVNNTVYWQVLEDELSTARPALFDAEIKHRTPADAGEATVLAAGPLRWIVGGEVHASIALGEG